MSLHEVYLLMGTNIRPEKNIRAALDLLRDFVSIKAISPVWETPAIGSDGPNFLNLVIHLTCRFSQEELKYQVLRKIEAQLGRVRSEDKNAPRPMDLDILLFDKLSLEPGIWSQAHIACPLSTLLPDLVDPGTGMRLSQRSHYFQQTTGVRQRSDLHFNDPLF